MDKKLLLERRNASLKECASAVPTIKRLTESTACFVSDAYGTSMNLERILKAAGQKVTGPKPLQEINANYPIVKRLKAEVDEARFADWSHILFDQPLLAEGGTLGNPATFVKRLNEVTLALASDVPSPTRML